MIELAMKIKKKEKIKKSKIRKIIIIIYKLKVKEEERLKPLSVETFILYFILFYFINLKIYYILNPNFNYAFVLIVVF